MSAYRPTPAAGDWKMGILADGLAAVHAATGDARIRQWLIAYADILVAERGRFADPRYALPLGYLAALTGDARYRNAALAVARTMKISDWGKPLAAMGRTGFRLLAPLAAPTHESIPTPTRKH
jgi:rhamnogalacturonyl hydrolase YesR